MKTIQVVASIIHQDGKILATYFFYMLVFLHVESL